MIRWRARITEDEPPDEARRKLAEVAEQIVTDPEEREFVEPRLQHLLGLTERVAPDREDLFSAWRLFLERMAEQFPVILVFEDIQWADAALLEFLEYLLDWSRAHPIQIVTLARPEIADRHPGWGANLRNSASLSLEPLSDDADRCAPARARPRVAGRPLARGSASAPTAFPCTPWRPCACCSTGACSSRPTAATGSPRDARRAGRARDAARAHRRALGRARAGGADAAAGRGRAGQDIRAARPGRAGRHGRGGAAALPRLARAQGAARPRRRPALAGARPVRLPPGARPAGRLRDAGAARPQGEAPRRGRLPDGRRRASTPTRSPRSWPPTCSTPTARNRTRRTRPRSRREARGWLTRAGERAASLAATDDAQPRLRERRRARRRTARPRAPARARRRARSSRQPDRRSRAAAAGGLRALRRGGRHARPRPGRRRARPGSLGARRPRIGARPRSRARLPCWLETSRMRT